MNGEILSIETAEKIAKLEKENKKLRIKCDFLANKKMFESDKNAKQIEIKAIEQIDYKTRNERAIEYIENNEDFETEIFDCNTGGCLGTDLSIQAKTLLNILQGKSDE